MIEDTFARTSWLTDTLEWLMICLKSREHISWQEIIERIDGRWLNVKGFGPPTVEVRALRGALISGQQTAGPPTASKAQRASAPVQVIQAFLKENDIPAGRFKKQIVGQIQQFARDRQAAIPSERTIRRHLPKS